MLAWTCTVHKVQGKQFKKCVISFDLLKQRTWNSGQIYVALSRVTSLDGLYLIGENNSLAIKAELRATIEYETMRKDYAMKSIDTCSTELPCSLTISLLNKKTCNRYKC